MTPMHYENAKFENMKILTHFDPSCHVLKRHNSKNFEELKDLIHLTPFLKDAPNL